LEYTAGTVLPVNIEDEMKRSYINYAMSVIASRALPDVRDGLKPVHRRILYTMLETGVTPDKPYRKAARVVGDVLGRYHPHGDAAVYDALVRMAQDFSTRYPLVDGHGNFGSIDGDRAAAMRYTEVRLTKLATELLTDIHKETVDFRPNYDETMEEPEVLPARFPNLLVNGAAGIAVGMATNIPPHNLGEVIDGVLMLIDNPDATVKDLMRIIKGPDFPTGGFILGRDGIVKAYETGRGLLRLRGRSTIETLKNGKTRIVISELPYQVNKANLIERIAELVRDKKIEGISDLRDETDRSGIRIVLDLKKGADARVILNKVQKFTPFEQTFGVILLGLHHGKPQVMNLPALLRAYLDHQKEVIVRRTRFDLNKAEARAHILQGLRVALDNLDAVIKLIRSAANVEQARTGLMEEFGLSEKQAQAILDMRLQRLTALEREKIETEYEEVCCTIEYLRAVLSSEKMVLSIIRQELSEIKEKYQDGRRTEITSAAEDLDPEDLIAEEDAVVTITRQGYAKRIPLTTYRMQRRGGRGVAGLHTREEDFVEHLFITTTHHRLLFFSNKGKVYQLRAYEIPEGSRTARGTLLVNLIQIEPDEVITAVIAVRELRDDVFLMMGTEKGMVKKIRLSELKNIRRPGLIALTLMDDDQLIGVRVTSGEDHVLLATSLGRALRFREEDVRCMGRTARGVIGIRLQKGDKVVGMDVIQSNVDFLFVSENGFGKRVRPEEFMPHGRATMGVRTMRANQRNGLLAGVRSVRPNDDVMLISSRGTIIRMPAADISIQGRTAQGVRVMRLEEGDCIVSLARAAGSDEGEES
jgi:DNA gyrase subunit A